MTCPFRKRVPDPTRSASVESPRELTRRAVLEYGSLFGGLFLLGGVGACTSAEDDDSDSSGGAATSSQYPFLTKYDSFAVASEAGPALVGAELIKARGALVQDWLTHRPADLFAELRAQRPVLVTGGPVPTIVASSADVARVLGDDATFPVAPYQNPINITEPPNGLGHFLLADLDLTRHEREKATFTAAMRSGEDSRAEVRAHAENLIAAVKARADGKVDVIEDIAQRLPIRMLGSTFGIPTGGAGQMTEAELYVVIGNVFRGLFMNLANDAKVQTDALAASATLWTYVEAQYAARKASITAATAMPADILGKFVWFQTNAQSSYQDVFASDERVIANLCGIVTGAVVGFGQALGNIVEVLTTQDPKVWKGAAAAATGEHVDTLWAHAQEALRFRPQGIGIVRATSVATKLGGVAIPAGNVVIASHQSAMMDEALVPRPSEFMLDRPASSYLHFGAARRTCLGRELAPVIITEALRVVLQLKNVRRAAGSKLVMGEPYPESLVLTYDA